MSRSFMCGPVGDKILFAINNEGEVVVTNASLLGEGYLAAVEAFLVGEWNSLEDEDAFGGL